MEKKPASERSADLAPASQVASQGQDLGSLDHHLQKEPWGQVRIAVVLGQ